MIMQFSPEADNSRDYRNALAQFATGITVVTAPTAEGGIGMTVNSFASVSLDPALVLWSAEKTSHRYPHFMAAKHFAIHVLRDDQQAVSNAFASEGEALSLVSARADANGVPVFDDCLARFDCETDILHDAGDHTIFVGRVRNVLLDQTGQPLIYSQRQYGSFKPI